MSERWYIPLPVAQIVDEAVRGLLGRHLKKIVERGIGPFDLQLAPDTDEGFFLGDYQALTNNGADFEPFYAQTNQGMGVSSDVFLSFPPNAAATVPVAAHLRARAAPSDAGLTPAARARMSERIRFAQAQRVPG